MKVNNVHTNGSTETLPAEVIDEITQRLNSSEAIEIEDYVSRYPELAGVLPGVLETLTLVRQPPERDRTTTMKVERNMVSSAIFASFARSAGAAWAWSTKPNRFRFVGGWLSRCCRSPGCSTRSG
jgi:hypothetical protein